MSTPQQVLSEEEVVKCLSRLYNILPKAYVDEIISKVRGKRLTREQVEKLMLLAVTAYYKTIVDPGEAIGIVTAQSIGEPSTQMVLRSFHYAGLREFSMALGLPRMIEIVDARRKPSRPMMTVYLQGEYAKDGEKALEVAKRIQLVTIENVAKSVDIDYISGTIVIELDPEQLRYWNLTLSDVRKALDRIRGKGAEVKLEGYNIVVTLHEIDPVKLRRVRDKILQTRLAGIKNVKKALAKKEGDEWIIRTEGTNLEAVLLVEGVDHRRTISNDIHEVAEVLGIEAARTVIMRELKKVLDEQGLAVDIRHIMLVADIMTWSGRVKQVGRHGVAGEKESPLARAAFEVTVRNLVEAALKGEVERFRSVIESVIAGKYVPVGTGMVELMMEL
ncbi:MAG: DNA-directed RNA polymerase subunit A'' [Crenarchaeota archaeon]|nr:DNA-directed RNA polymerase subunit A'' [Thermoproteota archaeon]